MKTFARIAEGVLAQTLCCTDDVIVDEKIRNPEHVFIEIPSLKGVGDLYFDGSAVVDRPNQPSRFSRWSNNTLSWFDPRTLQDFKSAKWAEIKQSRESTINSPLATPYGTFDAHAKARASITDAVLLLQTLSAQGTPQTIDWTLADNTVVTLTTAQMVEVGVLLGQQVQAAYAQARSLRLQIDASTTPQEVALVVWV